ncbi:DUF6153 family protein [Streptomyces sp. cmx-4-9]|uniref:DUF6153 family protein n=1 Tax=Streptomyces sp. cmx-4-9 TaxID=2790941 RepID=UPI00398138FC
MAAAYRTSRRPAGPGFVLLVLAVLTGVLAMHGLGPRPAPAAGPGQGPGRGRMAVHTAAGHAGAVEAAEVATGAAAHRAHPGGGSAHLDHADGTCAAAGVASAYAPPVPVAAVGTAAPCMRPPNGSAGACALAGRAPPDLSELQLLRI